MEARRSREKLTPIFMSRQQRRELSAPRSPSPEVSHLRQSRRHVVSVVAAIRAAGEGGILPRGKNARLFRRSANSRTLWGMLGFVPPGRMRGSTAGEAPAAAPLTHTLPGGGSG